MPDNNLLPLDIAREALRRLALQRVPPTPDNYRSFYHEIAGTQLEDVFPERSLKQVAAALPRDTPARLRLAHQFEHAIELHQWPAFKQAVLALYEAPPANQPSWGVLLRDLISQLELPDNGHTPAQKREALNHVLTSTPGNSDLLFSRLQGLLRGWQRAHADGDSPATRSNPPRAAMRQSDVIGGEPQPVISPRLADLLVVLLRRGIVPMIGDNAALAGEASVLAEALENIDSEHADDQIGPRVHALSAKLEWAGEDQRAVRQALLNLLRLIVSNISELIVDDNWLRGQIGVLTEVFSRPLDIRMLDEVERRLRDVIDKQGHLKRQLTDAQERLKSMLVGFVDRLSGFSDSTGHYHDTLLRCADEIRNAADVTQIATVIEEMLQETRSVQDTALRSREELNALREQVESANNHIARLQRELDETSELVRHDPLTGVLNRKGLDEAMEREISRARRRSAKLGIALLDIDNFKQLNDTFGHRTGDDALRHIASVMREALRPQDVVGRLGGEEFLILLPESDEDQCVKVVARLQRELTKRFFLADNQRLLITFSAGIALIGAEETPQETIDRADKAMYSAKKAGKNRVFAAA